MLWYDCIPIICETGNVWTLLSMNKICAQKTVFVIHLSKNIKQIGVMRMIRWYEEQDGGTRDTVVTRDDKDEEIGIFWSRKNVTT